MNKNRILHSLNFNTKSSNLEDLLKFLAIICMFIDHIGVFFFGHSAILRVIGRVVAPIFCFFAGYHAKTPKISIFLAGIFISCVTCIFAYRVIYIDILCMIFLGQYIIFFIKKYEWNLWIISFINLMLLLISYYVSFFSAHINYSFISIAFMICGCLIRNKYLAAKFLLSINFFCYLLYSQKTFKFSSLYFDILTLELIFTFLLLQLNYHNKVKFNYAIISRNSLLIYTLHLPFLILIKSFIN